MKQWVHSRLQTVPPTWNHRSSRWESDTAGAGESRIGNGMAMSSFLLIQIQPRILRNQGEHVADLVEAGAEEEVGVSAKALGAEDVEIGLGVAEVVGTAGGDPEAIVVLL